MCILFVTAAALIMGSLPLTAHADQQTTNAQHTYAEVRTGELKTWYDQGKQMIVVDARTEKNYNKIMLPQAIWLPYNASDADLQQTLPSKDVVIVVYCCNSGCPASTWMADRLVAAGYTNVYRYSEGLDTWMQQGLPTATTY